MKNRYGILVLLGSALLAGCQSAPDKAASTSAASALPRAALSAEATGLAGGQPYTGYHRYLGTVGGEPVTVMLTIDSTEVVAGKRLACTGSYYYGQGHAGLLVLSAKGAYQPRQPLQLQETAGGKATGTWQATQPAGPLL